MDKSPDQHLVSCRLHLMHFWLEMANCQRDDFSAFTRRFWIQKLIRSRIPLGICIDSGTADIPTQREATGCELDTQAPARSLDFDVFSWCHK